MLADRVRMTSKKGEDGLFLYNYGEIYGSVAENIQSGEVSYNSDHIEIMTEDFDGISSNSTITFDTPLTNLYSKLTIESELIRLTGDFGTETYFLNDTPNPPVFAPSNPLHRENKEHSKNSITLDMPSDANDKFFSVNLSVVSLGGDETRFILKVYSVKLHN